MTADAKTDWSAVSWAGLLHCIANGRPGAVEAAEKRRMVWDSALSRKSGKEEIVEAQATWAKAQRERA